MKILKSTMTLMLLLGLAVVLSACSGGSAPVNPDLATAKAPDSFGTKIDDGNIVAVYDAVIDPDAGTFTISPSDRVGSFHFPLTQLYPNVVKITGYGWTPNFWADIKLSHPFPGSGISGFDARVIAIVPANTGVSFNYPGFGAQGNNMVVLEPDGYTKLFDSLGGSIAGNTNPFKAYFKATDHRVWASTGTTSETQRWNMKLTGFGGPLTYKLVVDVSTNYPAAPVPVTDNAKEPVDIACVIGAGLTPAGGSATVTATLLDWQGSAGTTCQIEAPALFNGLVTLPFTGNGPNPNTYIFSGNITNSKSAAVGIYPVMIAGFDSSTQVYMFKEFSAEVKAVSTAKVRSTGFVQKPADDSFFDICVQPSKYVYVVADHPATGNVGGDGSTGLRTALRFNTALGNMEVINSGTGIAKDPASSGWPFEEEFIRLDVSDGGMLINDVGGGTLATWTVSGTTATNGACCWQYNCGLMSHIDDISDYSNSNYGFGVTSYATLNAGCTPPYVDWCLAFAETDPTTYAGYNNAAAALFADTYSVKGAQAIPGSLNQYVFYSSDTEGMLNIIGDGFSTSGTMAIIQSIGTYGIGPGQFKGGLDCAVDGSGNVLTLENHGGGVYRFQKFNSALTWQYESQWQDSGNPMRMDFDKSTGKLYLLVDSGVHVCTVD